MLKPSRTKKVVHIKEEKEEIRILCRAFITHFTALLHYLIDNFNKT